MDVAVVHRAAGNSGYLGLLVGLGWFGFAWLDGGHKGREGQMIHLTSCIALQK